MLNNIFLILAMITAVSSIFTFILAIGCLFSPSFRQEVLNDWYKK